MARRPQPADDRPARRSDATRPPRSRRGGDLAPYPGATGRVSAGRAATRSRPANASTGRATTPPSPTPTPATVWTCGPDPIDSHAPWPVPIVEAITTAFSSSGEHVVLAVPDTGTGVARTTIAEAVTSAREAVTAVGRTAEIATFDAAQSTTAPVAQPFWAHLVTDSATPFTGLLPVSPDSAPAASPVLSAEPTSGAREHVDLVIVSLPAHAAEGVSLDRLALLAAGLLRSGGIFAVYTHSDWNDGVLVDPTGPIVAACQHADLLYLQHVVALHTPLRESRLHAEPTSRASAEYSRAAHRAATRELPTPHWRAHSDVLVFAQPADHDTAQSPATPEEDA
ncbi:hypothetical protein [Amycolatopsis sp. WQ 127309]|uniref:hypothetical protein n=1 Tax=Amycolatopsis sp. WQ 127309 TaxID=2932773 RepID=UPI001FF1C180|nr:hypothetical protein [Amycolatopsis sp. WQ 127309]UOZ03424.1 hypothetical protein MUY22_31785 [Amycolatopsis sp. WQ 127309]